MAAPLEGWVRSWWRGDAGVPGRMASAAFLPAEWLFRGGARVRNRLYDAGVLPSRPGVIPVLSVGNLTVGGTGKTPLVAWFVSALQEAGARPAVVARGYGRDEILLHRRWHPDLPVVADPDRWVGVRRGALEGADVAVLDDGFQHRGLARDADVVLLAAETRFPGRRLPRGPYREGPRALARADLVVVTRRTASAEEARSRAAAVRRLQPRLPVAIVRLAPAGWRDLDGAPAAPPAGPVAVVTAVAGPEGVRALAAQALGREPASLALEAFPDHHEFRPEQVRAVAARGAALVVTEKDAVKLAEQKQSLGSAPVHVLTMEVVWEHGRPHAEAVVSTVLAARRERESTP